MTFQFTGDMSVVNAFYRNTLENADAHYPSLDGKTKCCFDKNDRRRSYGTYPANKSEDLDKYTTFVNRYVLKTLKSDVCFIVYLFQHLRIPSKNQTVYDLVKDGQLPKCLVDAKIDAQVKEICRGVIKRDMELTMTSWLSAPVAAVAPAPPVAVVAVAGPSRQSAITVFLDFFKKNLEKLKSKAKKNLNIDRDIAKLEAWMSDPKFDEHHTIREIARSFYDGEMMAVQVDGPSWKKAYKALDVKDRETIDSTNFIKWYRTDYPRCNIHRFLSDSNIYNPVNPFTLERFDSFALKDCAKILGIPAGQKWYFFIPEDFIPHVIQFGLMSPLDDLDWIHREMLVKIFTEYMQTASEEFKKVCRHAIQENKGFQEFLTIKGKRATLDQPEPFFKELLFVFVRWQQAKKVKLVYDASCNTLLDLISLYGYVCWSDDMNVGSELKEHRFTTSESCTLKFMSVFQEIKSMPELWSTLSAIEFNKKKLVDIIDDIPNTCIHGIGSLMMTWYLGAYISQRDFYQSLKRQRGGKKLKPMPALEDAETYHETLDEMFKLAPVFVHAPPAVKKMGYDFLSCGFLGKRTQEEWFTTHPLEGTYYIRGFTSQLTSNYIATIKVEPAYGPSPDFVTQWLALFDVGIDQALRYPLLKMGINVNLGVNPNWWSTPSNLRAEVATCFLDKDFIKSLLNISHTFHRQRIATFNTYADYTLQMCQLMNVEFDADRKVAIPDLDGVKAPKIEALASLIDSQTYFDLIKVEEMPIIPRYFTLIKFGKDQYYATSLHNLISQNYTKNQDDDVAWIKDMREFSYNIRDQYQTATLLAKMLIPKSLLPTKLNPTQVLELFSNLEAYYLMVFGQAMSFRSIIFANVSKKDGLNWMVKGEAQLSDPEKQRILTVMKFINNFSYYIFSKNTDIPLTVEKFPDMIECLIHRMICNDGNDEGSATIYHFTELSREYYLLKEIAKKFASKCKVTDPVKTKAKAMIKILNETFSYFAKTPLLPLLDAKGALRENAYTESIPIALEYMVKIKLIAKHQQIMTMFMTMERMLAYFVHLENARLVPTVDEIQRLDHSGNHW